MLQREVAVTAIFDPTSVRCEEEARLFQAEPASGVIDLVERPDVDAVLVPGGTWQGLWPVEQAARTGKPVLCAVSPTEDEAHLDALRHAANVHVALWPAPFVAFEALSEQAHDSIGPPLLLQSTWVRHGDGDLLTSPAALAIVRACADLFAVPPQRVMAQTGPSAVDFVSLTFTFASDRVAQLTFWGNPAARPTCRFQIEAEAGSAFIDLPRRIEWRDLAGRHSLELPAGLAEGLLLDRFVQAVRLNEPPVASLAWACEAVAWLRAARQSRESGQPVELGDSL